MNNKNNYAIKIEDLKKTYNLGKNNEFEALKGINLKIPKKSIFGLLGANGAGKSTLINIIAGLVNKTEGKVVVWNNDIDFRQRNAKLAIGVVPQELVLDPFFTPLETLKYQSGYYGVPKNEQCIEEILESIGLKDKANAYARSLSGGMRRRLMIGKAMVHRPPILILDEPTAGVDVELRQTLWSEIKKLNAAGVTIILTTHYLEEAEEMCDSLAIVNKGEIIAEGKTSDMLKKLDRKELIITLEKAIPKTFKLKNLNAKLISENQIKITFKPSETNEGVLIERIYENNLKIKNINSVEPDLEDVFLELTKN
ncbi:MAG: multidrug ABC transporter ATP-binding protein [Rickettsiales bacterium]|nr:multidrug ABC transporter ATP-binding protein [Rickettsiales bacterium]|tara:strand:- start:555 stop:1487 length:933 start_codon:yes stop_codon:yes gene_type:complete